MLSESVRKRMSEIGITQAELSRRSGLSTGHVADIVNGKCGKNITVPTIQALAKGLEVHGGYFFGPKNSVLRVDQQGKRTAKRVRNQANAQVE